MRKVITLLLAVLIAAGAYAGTVEVDAVRGEKISVDGIDDEWSGRLCCEGEGELGFGLSTDDDGMLNIALFPRAEALKRKAGMKGMRVTLYDPKDDGNKITVEFKGIGGNDTEEFEGMEREQSRKGYFENGNGSAEMSLSPEKCFAEISVPVSALPLNKSKLMMKVAMEGITQDDMKTMRGSMSDGERPSDGNSSMGGGRPSGGRPSGGMGGRPGGRGEMSQPDDMEEMSEDYEIIFEINIK